MIEFKRHFQRLQDALGVKNALGKNCVDVIDEGLWWNVMYQLNQGSIECANELQEETGKPYSKYYTDGEKAYDLKYRESPPTRLLSQMLVVSYWLGYLDADKSHYLHEEEVGALKRIKDAYESGKAANPNKR